MPSRSTRELMISVFYPAVHTGDRPFTHQFPTAVASAIGPAVEQNNELPAGLVNWAATRTHSVRDAAAAPGRFPVVLYSAGAGDSRDWNVSLERVVQQHEIKLPCAVFRQLAGGATVPPHRQVDQRAR
ncbi:hypothetical protein [Streptomyces canus]|uniref:hypothetical protein n=1 Tax=Streptomyces canus TaxID=58343 RepID=UPI0036E09B7F